MRGVVSSAGTLTSRETLSLSLSQIAIARGPYWGFRKDYHKRNASEHVPAAVQPAVGDGLIATAKGAVRAHPGLYGVRNDYVPVSVDGFWAGWGLGSGVFGLGARGVMGKGFMGTGFGRGFRVCGWDMIV